MLVRFQRGHWGALAMTLNPIKTYASAGGGNSSASFLQTCGPAGAGMRDRTSPLVGLGVELCGVAPWRS
jgi:hypothetical protein